VTAPDLVRCATCGNLPTTRRPLRWDRDAAYPRAVHAWMPCDQSRDPDFPDSDTRYSEDGSGMPVCGHAACNDLWPCPKPPDGWGMCVRCREAGPASDERRLGVVVPAVIETVGGEASTTRYGSHELEVYVHAGPCPKDARDRATRTVRHSARRTERDEEDEALSDQARADAVPFDGDGVAITDLMALWAMKERATRNLVARLVGDGVLRFEEVATRAGGARRKVYWRVA
jgi:hypothetical protein